MSLVRRYVHEAGGKIALASLPGFETRFKITLPVTATAERPADPRPLREPPAAEADAAGPTEAPTQTLSGEASDETAGEPEAAPAAMAAAPEETPYAAAEDVPSAQVA
jgi:hypothetical protein